MIEKAAHENAKRIADKYIADDGGPPKRYCDEALEAAGIKPSDRDENLIRELAQMSELAYQKRRDEAAAQLGIRVTILDKVVRQGRAKAGDKENVLPHWEVEPWGEPVEGATLLDDIEKMFRRYIVLPAGAAKALALWTLHAWTMDAGDISPFMVLVSPAPRCGKTNVMTILYYLTPRSELASNISPSAVFRYVEAVRPTLLMDEADSFVKGNEEMRGILDSGHTRTGAQTIRNVEVNGEYKAHRFSTWAPKAIATIKSLANTLEDRSIIVKLQRKSKAAKVERLRKRDSDGFALLRRKAARWATDNFSRLTDPDPSIPEVLNDRAADNWRPLLAIADLAGDQWPQQAREAACLLSGEGHDATSINVELLKDIRLAFGNDDIIRTVDLLARLTADPERPWVEWHNGKPLSPKRLSALLVDFGIISVNVNPPGLAQGKGYRRADFEAAWDAYCPGQNPPFGLSTDILPSIRPLGDEMGTTRTFSAVHDTSPVAPVDGKKAPTCSTSMGKWTDGRERKGGGRCEG
jgi:putative DNA primase/helicase